MANEEKDKLRFKELMKRAPAQPKQKKGQSDEDYYENSFKPWDEKLGKPWTDEEIIFMWNYDSTAFCDRFPAMGEYYMYALSD